MKICLDILTQIYGNQLTNDATEDFIAEIEQTVNEIEKLREKDEVIE